MKLPLILLLLALPMTSLAHSGGTNSQGCHTDHSTGDRHCHTDRAVPSHWSKDVDVGPAPVVHRPVQAACPVGAVSSNLIIDQYPSACAPVAPVACVACLPTCAAGPCGNPIVSVKVKTPARTKVDPAKHSFYFKNCEEVFTARRAPLHRGDDGYRAELDADGDGVACDPMVMW